MDGYKVSYGLDELNGGRAKEGREREEKSQK